ncbi:MAG: hypothetical protein JO249_22860 [Acidobacteria bacterium]|nr:hypothetical protein [Acidobacteriota bacterium]
MDEVDVLVDNPRMDSRELLSFFRGWSDGFGIPFVVVSRTGKLEPLIQAATAGSPFWNILKVVPIGPFQHDEALELICRPAERCKQPFTPAEVEWIHECGGHHPFFIQIAASCAFTRRGMDPALRELMFLQEADQHLEYLLDFMPDKERDALRAFVEKKDVDARARLQLIQKGILIEENGTARLFSIGLTEKLLARYSQPESQRSTSSSILSSLHRFFR